MSANTARQVLRLTPRQRLQLALDTDLGLRTIDALYEGKRVHFGTYERGLRSAKRLGFPLPPAQPPRPGVCAVNITARR
jgi:hypothetical protein